jgi:hypothetical protein
LCGRYEGIDDRIREEMVDVCYSLGDFVLNGGEVAALAMFEAVARLRVGVLGNPESIETESFAADLSSEEPGSAMLEHPHYTRPAIWRGKGIPKLLLSGDHAAVARWRRHAALARTHALRPDLRGDSSTLSGALQRPSYVVVALRQDFDLSALAPDDEAQALGILWVGGRGKVPAGVDRVRNFREARQRVRRELRAYDPKEPSGSDERVLDEPARVWTVEVANTPGPDEVALSAQALGDLLICEEANKCAPHAILYLIRWGEGVGPAAIDATLSLGETSGSSPQKDRKGLAIEAPLIDISQPAQPQVRGIVRAIGRHLDSRGTQTRDPTKLPIAGN